MDIDRDVPQQRAQMKIAFCIDQIEDADCFDVGIDWETTIACGDTGSVTLEEIIGALVAAEQYIKNMEE